MRLSSRENTYTLAHLLYARIPLKDIALDDIGESIVLQLSAGFHSSCRKKRFQLTHSPTISYTLAHFGGDFTYTLTHFRLTHLHISMKSKSFLFRWLKRFFAPYKESLLIRVY